MEPFKHPTLVRLNLDKTYFHVADKISKLFSSKKIVSTEVFLEASKLSNFGKIYI